MSFRGINRPSIDSPAYVVVLNIGCAAVGAQDVNVVFCTPPGRIYINGLFIPRPICARRFYAGILRLAGPFGLLPSPGTGGPEARLRSAFRISVADARRSVATSVSQVALESRVTNHTHPDYDASS
jgi:hypothetical protein